MEINGNTKLKELLDALAHDDVSEETDELTHWGIKGMRWGVRRYQNKDGSLTKAGQKRLKAETDKVKQEEKTLKNRKSVQNKLNKLAARKKAVEDEKKQLDDEQKKSKSNSEKTKNQEVKKSVKDMGDEELAYKIRRAQLEKQYEALIAEPEPAAKGNGFVKDFMNKSAVPAMQEAGKTLIRDSLLKAGRKYLGLETDTVKTVDKLKEEFETLNYKDKIQNLKNKAAKAAEKEKAKQETKAAKQEAKQAAKEEKTVVYEIYDNPSKTRREGKKWTNDSPVYEVDYADVVNNNNTSSGRSYVSNYLSAPTPRLGLPAPRDDR